jgi:hypothetical protein
MNTQTSDLTKLVLLALMIGSLTSGCVSENPVEGTYKKGVEGGERAIQKADDVQKQIDQSNSKLQEQQKQLGN